MCDFIIDFFFHKNLSILLEMHGSLIWWYMVYKKCKIGEIANVGLRTCKKYYNAKLRKCENAKLHKCENASIRKWQKTKTPNVKKKCKVWHCHNAKMPKYEMRGCKYTKMWMWKKKKCESARIEKKPDC